MELDSENEALQAQIAEAYSAALAEKERELAELRAQLAAAQAPGPPALAAGGREGRASRDCAIPCRRVREGHRRHDPAVADRAGRCAGAVRSRVPRSVRLIACQAGTAAREAGQTSVVTASRPGKCANCTWDIVPGDKIVHLGEAGSVHFECAPADDVPLPGPERGRSRPRAAS